MTDDYNGQHTGEEIDKAIAAIKALGYSVAPAGYGLGSANWIANDTDVDTLITNGWYSYTSGNTSANKPFSMGSIFVFGRSSSICTQLAINDVYAGPYFQVRKMADGVWGEWEWVNPPMYAGVEYRTTERHKGEPVYAVRLYGGALENSGNTTLYLPNATSEIIDISGVAVTSDVVETFPIIGVDGAVDALVRKTGSYSVVIKTFADYSASTAYVTVKYTKD